MPTLSALSIARPLVENQSSHTFSGQIFGLFTNVCNVIGNHKDVSATHHKIITLSPENIPKGPFSIIVEDAPHFFASLRLGQPVRVSERQVVIGPWTIQLETAQIWEPTINWPEKKYVPSPTVIKLLEPWTEWPAPQTGTAIMNNIAHLTRQAANQLQQALRDNQPLEASVSQLAGLGGGLTPAGDDYLLGVIAALWLLGDGLKRPLEVAAIAAPKTTTLSAAFLTAAGEGKFIELWHKLVQALAGTNHDAVSKAINDLGQFGASSGRDALAGFAEVVLCWKIW